MLSAHMFTWLVQREATKIATDPMLVADLQNKIESETPITVHKLIKMLEVSTETLLRTSLIPLGEPDYKILPI